MQAAEFFEKSTDAKAWRKHSRALRRSADVLWDDFVDLVGQTIERAKAQNETPEFEVAVEAMETTKLLYGLALETALKAWLIEHSPEKVEVRLTLTGDGSPKQAELKSFGVPASSGHNILALAEIVGVFGPSFAHVHKGDRDVVTLRNICRDLGEVVVWRGRYPVPMSSYDPIAVDPAVPFSALAHYMRDWLDPLLDALLAEREDMSAK